VEPSPGARKRRVWPVVAVVAILAVLLVASLTYWAWPRPGPPVKLLGINRTLTYSGNASGYVFGTITSGCPECPVTITAGATEVVNITWLTTDPFASHLNYTFVNVTIVSPYPFREYIPAGSNGPTLFRDHYMWSAGGPGGGDGLWISIEIPFDSSGLPATGTIVEWINASASNAPWPTPA
jgi:hypothetical protein